MRDATGVSNQPKSDGPDTGSPSVLAVMHQYDRPVLERLLVFLLIRLMSLDWADKQAPIRTFSWQ